VRRRLLLRAGVDGRGHPLPEVQQAEALLVVSGSQPLRGALSWTGLLQDSSRALRSAEQLQQEGLMPGQVALWAVANPVRDSADSLARKVPHCLSALSPNTLGNRAKACRWNRLGGMASRQRIVQ
jgi:hypothetical protein